jgi:RecA-family ATPase
MLAEKGLPVLHNGYELIPIKPGGKFPVIEDWQNISVTDAVMQGWSTNGHANDGIGIRTKFTPLADIDCRNREMALEMAEWFQENVGLAPVRIGMPPKRGLLYRAAEPFRKVSSAVWIDENGRENKVEVLGDGQQFVAFAIHPETKKPYFWLGRQTNPEFMPAAELGEITQEQARAGVAYFERRCRERGWIPKRRPPAQEDDGNWDDAPLGLSEEAIRKAVADIPNKDWEYEDGDPCWLGILQGVAHETRKSDQGQDIAYRWSILSGKHEHAKFKTTWDSLENYSGRRRTFKYVLKWARHFRPKLRKTARSFKLSQLAESEVPVRKWQVPDWIPMDRVTGLYGEGGTGKTLLAQMLATASALAFKRPAVEWLGLPVQPARSVLLLCENDQDEIHIQQERINEYYDCKYEDLEPVLMLPRLGEHNNLARLDGSRIEYTSLFDELFYAALGHEAKLVFADTVSDTFFGNESDRNLVRAFVQMVYARLARELHAAVVALAHPSVAGMANGTFTSGSTAWNNTFRSRMVLMHDATPGLTPDFNARVLKNLKANFAQRGLEIRLRWQNGVLVSTGVGEALANRTDCEQVFLDLVDRMTSDGQRVSHSSRAGNYAPKIFELRPDAEGYTKGDFERAMHALFARRIITNATYKDRSRNTSECISRLEIEL